MSSKMTSKRTYLTASETFSSMATFHQLARHLVGGVFESLRGLALYCGGLGSVLGTNGCADDRPLAAALAIATGRGASSRRTALASAAPGLRVSYPARGAKDGSPSVQKRTRRAVMSNHGVANLMSGTPPAPLGPVLPKAPTGIRGLDEITRGGLPRGRTALVTGGTGTGK